MSAERELKELKRKIVERRALFASICLHLILFISMAFLWPSEMAYKKVRSIEAATVTLLELPKVEEKIPIPPKVKPQKPKLTPKPTKPVKLNPQIDPSEKLPKLEGHLVTYRNLKDIFLPEPSRQKIRSSDEASSEKLPDIIPHRKRSEVRELEGSLDSVKTHSVISNEAFALPPPKRSISTEDEKSRGRNSKGEGREGKEGKASNYSPSAQIGLPTERLTTKGIQPKSPAFRITGEVTGRKVVYWPPNPEAKSEETGEVELRFWVTPDGSVFNIIIKKKSGSPLLDRLAREYVEKIRFAELDRRFEPRNQWGDITIDFTRFKSQ